ncbi:MAG: hypothetical protein H6738_01805 [Alphaproteobacteria bacterium]|nr:hypothetical protein [Alphaproteobacteria bacterium]MCB9695503.1 hypothetical protein [Alphaproteobacteria bacterium]
MPVRDALSSLLSRAVERRVREWIRDANAADDARIAELEGEIEKLKKKLSMTQGAIQASTAELMKLKGAADESRNVAQQAMQRATSALAAAESATEGVTALELHLAEHAEPEPEDTGSEPEPEPEPKGDHLCQVDGCDKPVRAKGYCARHYQQWKRGTL